MQDLLINPVVQSAIAPAIAAAVVAALVLRTRAFGLVPLAGFAVVVALAVGFSVEPTTARAKAVLAISGAGALGLVLDLAGVRATAALRVALALLVAAAALWVSVRVLQQKEADVGWGVAAGIVALAVAMAESWRLTVDDPVRALVSAAALAFTSGVLGLLGASSSVALTGIAFGSACGVGLIAKLWRGRDGDAPAFATLAVMVFAVLGGLLASLTGELPGHALAPLVLVPLAVRLVPRTPRRPAWRDALLASAAALPPAALAVALGLWPLVNRSPS